MIGDKPFNAFCVFIVSDAVDSCSFTPRHAPPLAHVILNRARGAWRAGINTRQEEAPTPDVAVTAIHHWEIKV